MPKYTDTLLEVQVDGTCVTRNGRSKVGKIRVSQDGKDGNVQVSFISSKLHRSLNAGCVIRMSDLDDLCVKWVHRRGLASNNVIVDRDRLLQALDAAEHDVAAARGMVLSGKS